MLADQGRAEESATTVSDDVRDNEVQYEGLASRVTFATKYQKHRQGRGKKARLLQPPPMPIKGGQITVQVPKTEDSRMSPTELKAATLKLYDTQVDQITDPRNVEVQIEKMNIAEVLRSKSKKRHAHPVDPPMATTNQ